jgi:hypothetical protein
LNADVMAMAYGKQSRSRFGSGFLFVQLEIFFGDSEWKWKAMIMDYFLEPNAEYFVSKWGIWWDVYNSDKSRKVDDALIKKKEKVAMAF